jgi:replicative DNA helicase
VIESVSELAGANPNLQKARRQGPRPGADALRADRLPPHAPEAEQGVLGCVLLSPNDCLNQLLERRLAADWFYDLRHQEIFKALLALHGAQVPVDIITLQQKLKEWQLLEQVGGIPYLNALQDAVPSAANLSYYLDIVREKFQLRRLVHTCTDVVGRVYDYDGDVQQLLDEVERDFSRLTETNVEPTEKTLRQVIQGVIGDMDDHHYTRGSAQLRGLPTAGAGNYTDKMIRGIREDFYVVLAGRPGDGKTSLALNWIEYLALDYVWHQPTGEKHPDESPVTVERRGIPIGMFSLEMSEQSLGYRLLFGRAGIDSEEWNTGFASNESERDLTIAAGRLAAGEVIIDDSAGQSINQIAAKARRWAKQYGIKLFVLDYLQLAEGDNVRDEDRVRLAKISKKIMALKKQLKVPWLVLCQMNRNIETAESKRTPVLSDLKDCGAIEQDADVVLFLYKPDRKQLESAPTDKDGTQTGLSEQDILDRAQAGVDASKKARRVNLFVAKHRYGPTGPVKLLFQKNLCRFEDWHLFAVKHGIEQRNLGESPNVVKGPATIDPEDMP